MLKFVKIVLEKLQKYAKRKKNEKKGNKDAKRNWKNISNTKECLGKPINAHAFVQPLCTYAQILYLLHRPLDNRNTKISSSVWGDIAF